VHRRGDDDQVVLRPPDLWLEAGLAEEVQELVRAADDALCPIQRGRVGNRSVRFDDISQHEPSALRQLLRHPGKQVRLHRVVDVMQGERGDDQLEGPFRERILEAAESQLGSRAEDAGRRVQLVAALVEADGARHRVRLEAPPRRLARADPEVEQAAHLEID